jgi:hypothetical protein
MEKYVIFDIVSQLISPHVVFIYYRSICHSLSKLIIGFFLKICVTTSQWLLFTRSQRLYHLIVTSFWMCWKVNHIQWLIWKGHQHIILSKNIDHVLVSLLVYLVKCLALVAGKNFAFNIRWESYFSNVSYFVVYFVVHVISFDDKLTLTSFT